MPDEGRSVRGDDVETRVRFPPARAAFSLSSPADDRGCRKPPRSVPGAGNILAVHCPRLGARPASQWFPSTRARLAGGYILTGWRARRTRQQDQHVDDEGKVSSTASLTRAGRRISVIPSTVFLVSKPGPRRTNSSARAPSDHATRGPSPLGYRTSPVSGRTHPAAHTHPRDAQFSRHHRRTSLSTTGGRAMFDFTKHVSTRLWHLCTPQVISDFAA